MTALDDALNSSSITFDAPKLTASWVEIPAPDTPTVNPESANNLTGQMTGEFTVTHSLDDALPDPVTMTSGNDASGGLTASLTGRQALVATSWGVRALAGITSGGGTETTVPHHPDVQHGDYEVIIISTNSGATMDETKQDLTSPYRWRLLGSVFDGTALRSWVWGRHYYTGSAPLRAYINNPLAVQFTCITLAFYGRAIENSVVPFKLGTIVSGVAGASTTSHVVPNQTIKRGIAIGVWSAPLAAGTWTATGGATEIYEYSGAPVIIMAAYKTADYYLPTTVGMSATSTVATTDATYLGIPLELCDRPRMDARRYFSPFNKNSPIYGFSRDTAGLALDYSVITTDGPVSTRLYTGQMSDIPLRGQAAELSGVSKTRLDLDKSVTLPIVKGDRENCSLDFLATWLMARGGQFVGPSPGPNTIYWAPMYGSLHAHLDGPYCYTNMLSFPGAIGIKYPTQIVGPFAGAMYAEQTTTRTLEIKMDLNSLYQSRNVQPQIPVGPLFEDQLSDQSSSGRLSFWIRGDAWGNNISYYGGSGDVVMYQLTTLDGSNVYTADIQVWVSYSTRRLGIQMQSPVGAYSAFVLFPTAIPQDGEWHFVGIAWDWEGKRVKYKIDATEGIDTTTFAAAPFSALPYSDDDRRAVGGRVANMLKFHSPVSDVQIDSGLAAYTDSWTRHYPVPAGLNATHRPTGQRLEAIAEETPVQSWALLAELARASLSAYRINELDGYQFLPPSYFGEIEQLTPAAIVVDTEVNASELDVKLDATKIRNVVTVEYDETKAASTYTTVYALSSATEIPKGVTSFTFALDQPLSEIHNSPSPNQPLTLLTAAQITTPSTIPTNLHHFSANTLSDGSGTVLTSIAITAIISSFTASSVTITFTNSTAGSVWVVNNGTDVPFLRILGYPVKVAKGYVTVRDTYSVAIRRERPLTVEMPWIHDRDTATQVAQALVVLLAQPRGEVSLKVMGDPRRTPGQLVTIKDSFGTQAEGNWRILSVTHTGNGPEYTQDLSLVSVPPTAVWDGVLGWDQTSWGE